MRSFTVVVSGRVAMAMPPTQPARAGTRPVPPAINTYGAWRNVYLLMVPVSPTSSETEIVPF